MPNQKQSIIITGGASGLGLALARRLHAAGHHLALLDLNAAQLEKIREEMLKDVFVAAVDSTEPEQVNPAVETFARQSGRIDALVNCVGITGQTNLKSHEVSLEDFDRVMRTNVRSCLVASRAVIPRMLAQKYGRVLHVASIAGKEGNAGMVAYSASKGAVIALTKSQGKDYAETGVTINAVAPAVIRTAMHDTMPETQFKYMTDKIPMKRCGTLDEFATLASFIISPENTFTTGFTYDLSGGRATY
jgi:3-oxoacyl-[acyl-carrier protein] reductase